MVAAQSTTSARAAARPDNSEAETIVREAIASGKCSPAMADLWREIGAQDMRKLYRLDEIAGVLPPLDAMQASLAQYLARLHELRDFVVAFKFAAFGQERAKEPGVTEMDWASLMRGLQRMVPEDSQLEDGLTWTLEVMSLLSGPNAQRAAQDANGQAALARRSQRAELAASASQRTA